MRRRIVGGVARSSTAGMAGAEEPRDAAPLHQAHDKGRIAFVMLLGEFALGILVREDQWIDFDVEGCGKDAAVLLPLVEQYFDDVDFVCVAEDAGIDALFHDGERIAYHQLVAGKATIAAASLRLGDDAGNIAQAASVCDELQFDRNRNKLL